MLGGRMMFQGRLEDLVRKEILASFLSICAPCYKQAMAVARERLKKAALYREREDIREFVRIMENMEGVDTAGHEFDVLPEELRRYALIIVAL